LCTSRRIVTDSKNKALLSRPAKCKEFYFKSFMMNAVYHRYSTDIVPVLVGDPEEINAIDKVFCKDRQTPLLIGSVKSNLGHSEAAAGLCQIAKVRV